MNKELLNEIEPAGSILMTYRGSISHGTFIPSDNPNSIDDIDLMGVYIESPDFYMGLDHKTLGYGGRKTDSQEYWVENYDIVNYELRKLFGLLLKGNPNVLMLLFLNEEHVISKDPLWDKILENKDVFLSSKAFYSFGGYANEQLRKMTSFKTNEVEGMVSKIKEELKLRESNAGRRKFDFIDVTTSELRARLNTLSNTQGYMGEKRRGLVDEYGYDIKNAAHLIRLLRMGVEYLKEGKLTVDRTGVDADELKEIKTGKWTLEQVKEEARFWEHQLGHAFENTTLPNKPDFEGVNQLCTEIIKEYYERMRYAG